MVQRIPLRATPTRAASGAQLPRYRRRARLLSLADYRAELNKMYRLARAGSIKPQDATRFAFVLRTGHDMLRMQQELLELRKLRDQLAALQGSSSMSADLPPYDGRVLDGDLLPAPERTS